VVDVWKVQKKMSALFEWPITLLSPFTVFWSYLSVSNEKMQYMFTYFFALRFTSFLPPNFRLRNIVNKYMGNSSSSLDPEDAVVWKPQIFHGRKEGDGVKDFVRTVLMLQ